MKAFKITFSLVLNILFITSALAQKDKSFRPSPPDQITKEINGKSITIDYSQPSKKGREIFGGLVDYGKVWRTGANEASWVEFSKDVEVNGEKIAAGKYSFFTIPGEEEWTIIFNENWNQWGAYNYDESKDVLRVKAPAQDSDFTEKFTISFDDEGIVAMMWDTTKVSFSVQ